MKYLLLFVFTMLFSVLLYFPVRYFGNMFNIVAVENERTVHHGRIVRIGGVAIYLSFVIVSLFYFRHNRTFDGLLIGSTVIFIFGLLDDIFSLKPLVKLIGQFIAATCAIFIGNICLRNIHLFLGITIQSDLICYLITYLWIIGITNAINLLDGLDGLAAGFTIIVLIIVSLLSTLIGNSAIIIPLCCILAGAIAGFLVFNFHPAKIIMGDCGSQLLGFMLASIALFGFRKATFITLMVPILLLFIPIFDTLIAIIRRKISGKAIMSADKGHLHHMLMNKIGLGQVGAVLVIYGATALFGLTAYLFIVDFKIGLILLIVLLICFELFVEYTSMISAKYRPILNLIDKIKAKNK
ncbi:MAG: MraY family glycosyltransferase [Erysipelotrichaceae bacterium]